MVFVQEFKERNAQDTVASWRCLRSERDSSRRTLSSPMGKADPFRGEEGWHHQWGPHLEGDVSPFPLKY